MELDTLRNLSVRENDPEIPVRVFGPYSAYVKRIENEYSVDITLRGDHFTIEGKKKDVDAAHHVLSQLVDKAERDQEITENTVDYLIRTEGTRERADFSTLEEKVLCYTTKGKPIRPKTYGQKKYLDAFENNDIVFGIGPAGTGKTYLAMAKAITSFKNDGVDRLILTRPAVEAGEKLGFLPGDLQEKVDPYLRPLYDALYDILGAENLQKNMEKGFIEVAPLAYMRGRTLENAYIILDEAQNTTPEQMKMFLTRFGQGSKMIVTGDVTQIDLPTGKKSGLKEAKRILEGVKGIKFITFEQNDVVRDKLVLRIIEAYDKDDRRKEMLIREKMESSGKEDRDDLD